MKVNINPNRQLYNYSKPYIIAELGANHNGDMDLARTLIKQAHEAGADCIKFQSWSAEKLSAKKVYEDNFFLTDDYRNRTDTNLKEIIEKYSISEAQLLEMKSYASELGIDCASTPFSKGEVDFLVEGLDAPFIKVASMDLNNYPFLKYIAAKQRPIVLSTGLSSLDEIDKAVACIEAEGNTQIIILHCVSIYPPKDEEVNLNNIKTLQQLYPYPIGFSDHTIGTSIPLASIAMGVCLIEKHFTLDKEMEGWDHKVSADKDDLKIICESAARIHTAMGSFRIKSVESMERKNAFRRSIIAARDIKEGDIIQEEDLEYKRPGEGLAPEDGRFLIGKPAKRDIEKDTLIFIEDI